MTPKGNPKTRDAEDVLALALDAIGDPWSYLILQEAFFGVRRFDAFQENLGVARNTLTDRLVRLVENNLLERRAYQQDPLRYEYRLTRHGLATYPYALALMRWGDDWLAGRGGPPVTLVHRDCAKAMQPVATCANCAREVRAEDVSIGLGTARMAPRRAGTSIRYSSRPQLYTAGRPTSVSRTLALIGDRWAFLVLWLAMAGTTKFEHFHRILGIARTILTVRLERLTEAGLLERRLYLERPPRYDYHLTTKGKTLCTVLLTLFDWGQRWLGIGEPDGSVVHKACGRPLRIQVSCGNCGLIVDPRRVSVLETAPVLRWEQSRLRGRKTRPSARQHRSR